MKERENETCLMIICGVMFHSIHLFDLMPDYLDDNSWVGSLRLCFFHTLLTLCALLLLFTSVCSLCPFYVPSFSLKLVRVSVNFPVNSVVLCVLFEDLA